MIGAGLSARTQHARLVSGAGELDEVVEVPVAWGTPEFLRAEMIDANPMIWFIEVNGLPFDARELPVEIQVEAYRQGVIPYVPDLGRDGTAAAEAALRS